MLLKIFTLESSKTAQLNSKLFSQFQNIVLQSGKENNVFCLEPNRTKIERMKSNQYGELCFEIETFKGKV